MDIKNRLQLSQKMLEMKILASKKVYLGKMFFLLASRTPENIELLSQVLTQPAK